MRIPADVPLDKDGQYCMSCFSKNVERVFNDGRTQYRCNACGKTLERTLVIDNKTKWWIDENRTYWHESVGILVVAEGRLLTFLRKIFPFSYTIPAGHVDEAELPEDAALRELQEETGISLSSLELFKENFDIVGDSCRRGSDNHRWNLYRALLPSRPTISLSDEGSDVRFMTLRELQEQDKLTFPLAYLVRQLGEKLFS